MSNKMPELEALASRMIGDGQTPDLFFVTDEGAVVLIETSGLRAYGRFKDLASRSPRKECALENRTFGVLASVEPESDDPGARLRLIDHCKRVSSDTIGDGDWFEVTPVEATP